MTGVPSHRYLKAKGLVKRAPRQPTPYMPAADQVYFVQAETLGLVKIGFATDARSRLRSLQVGSPDRLTLLGVIVDPLAARLEQNLHAKFQAHHVHGEWFWPAADLLAFIRSECAASKMVMQDQLLSALSATLAPA